jgi:predicted acylesterase/phospholipase RssA
VDLSDLSVISFHEAKAAIEAGRRAALERVEDIRAVLEPPY